jgi:hypothetical protein
MRRHFEESKLWGIIPSEGDVEELKESVKPSIMIVLYHYTSISTVSTRVRAELSITSSDVVHVGLNSQPSDSKCHFTVLSSEIYGSELFT